mmetsp:Transcript_58255/g.189889  ORF Transcript_58255/g.189889 Transcript_58255/m.189889 type:complete len:447 (-) Transcript_58255:147-1487(-)
MLCRSTILIVILIAAPCVSEEVADQCGDEAGSCTDDASMLSTRVGQHRPLKAVRVHAEAEAKAGGHWWSRRLCSSKCALGENIRVVTDMGFDDWGAFSLLNAAGCAPQKALGIEGMLSSNFTGNLSKLLKSWGLDTEVYQGPPDNTCYTGKPCIFNVSTVTWLQGYRAKVYETLPLSTKEPWAEVEQWSDDVNSDMEEFWACPQGQEYTLLVISPSSAVAAQLLDASSGEATRNCIKEIVFMGGLFSNVQLNQNDPATAGSFSGPAFDLGNTSDASLLTEVNVVSDALAAQALWETNLATLGMPVRIFSLETASVAREGLQEILASGKTGMVTDTDQYNATENAVARLKENIDCSSPASMLAQMVCIHDKSTVATLDFDAIAAAYIWVGAADKMLNFNFERNNVTIETISGVATKTSADNSAASVATTFMPPLWFELLRQKLLGKR